MSPESALALRWEDQVWHPQHPIDYMSRAAAARIGTPYRAAVPATIANLRFALDPAVVAAAEDARAEVTRFDAEVATQFADGHFAPLASVLLRTESSSSSQIENITASSRALALAELGLSKFGTNAALVVANVDAMQQALTEAEQITPGVILAIHKALMHEQPHADPGEFRTQPVWIGPGRLYPHDALFIPPHHTRIEAAIADLCAFTERADLPLLAHVALAHAQFETIHPFSDGNGRTGRALVHAMLKHAKATTQTTVPVSAGLLADTGSYFEALTAYRAGDPNPIVSRFTDAALVAINNSRTLATDLRRIEAEWRARLVARSDSVAWRILPLLLAQPAVTSRLVQERTGASQPAVDRALRQLQDADIVVPKTEYGEKSKRSMVWRSDAVLEALDTFGERARRKR